MVVCNVEEKGDAEIMMDKSAEDATNVNSEQVAEIQHDGSQCDDEFFAE